MFRYVAVLIYCNFINKKLSYFKQKTRLLKETTMVKEGFASYLYKKKTEME